MEASEIPAVRRSSYLDDVAKSPGHPMKLDAILNKIKKPLDLLNLEKIIAEQPYLYQLATEEMASVKSAMNDRKFDLDMIYSDVYLSLKNESVKTGARKTEAQLTEEVKAHPNYQLKMKQYLAAKYDVEKLESVRRIFEQRENAIGHLVKLYGSQYWSMHESANVGGTD